MGHRRLQSRRNTKQLDEQLVTVVLDVLPVGS